MNKFILVFILITFSLQFNAQIQQSMILTGGSFSFSGLNSNNEQTLSIGTSVISSNSYSLRISPEIGRFISESTLVGIGINLSATGTNFESDNTNENIEKIRQNNISIAPYVKKYIELKEKFYFTAFVGLSAGIGESTRTDFPESDMNILNLAISGRPGLSYFVSDRWAIQANLGEIFLDREVWTQKEDNEISETKTTQYKYGANFRFNSFGIGFNYLLGQQNN